jgi:outer membrane protein
VADVAAAKASVGAGEDQLEATQQQQLLNAANAYLDAYRDLSDVQLSRHLEQVLNVNLQNVQSTFQAGAATETDTSQAEARLSGAVAARLAAEGRLASSTAAFRTTVGREPGTLDKPEALGSIPADLTDAEMQGVAANPMVAEARSQVAADKAMVRSLMGQLLPQVDAIAEYQDVDNFFTRSVRLNSLYVGVQASVPLYAAGVNYSRIRAARDRWEADDKQEIEAEREVRQQVDSAWNQLGAARAEQRSYADQIRANEIALQDTMKEVSVGTRTRLDTLNAEQELFQSQVDLVNADHDTLAATFALEAALGSFNPQGLGLSVATYDVGAYRDKVKGAWFGLKPPQ